MANPNRRMAPTLAIAAALGGTLSLGSAASLAQDDRPTFALVQINQQALSSNR